LHVTGELETKPTHSAARLGRNPDELVQHVLRRYFEEEIRGASLHGKSGAALVEATHASPYKEIDLQPGRDRVPVRDAGLQMAWLLDTNVLSELRRPRPEAKLSRLSPITPLKACIQRHHRGGNSF
jgi:hypothetical protein